MLLAANVTLKQHNVMNDFIFQQTTVRNFSFILLLTLNIHNCIAYRSYGKTVPN
jgi:hypothetical protein